MVFCWNEALNLEGSVIGAGSMVCVPELEKQKRADLEKEFGSVFRQQIYGNFVPVRKKEVDA